MTKMEKFYLRSLMVKDLIATIALGAVFISGVVEGIRKATKESEEKAEEQTIEVIKR